MRLIHDPKEEQMSTLVSFYCPNNKKSLPWWKTKQAERKALTRRARNLSYRAEMIKRELTGRHIRGSLMDALDEISRQDLIPRESQALEIWVRSALINLNAAKDILLGYNAA